MPPLCRNGKVKGASTLGQIVDIDLVFSRLRGCRRGLLRGNACDRSSNGARALLNVLQELDADTVLGPPRDATTPARRAVRAQCQNEFVGQSRGICHCQLRALLGCIAQRAFDSWSIIPKVDESRVANQTASIFAFFAGLHGQKLNEILEKWGGLIRKP
jgi:hypothetical protein